MAVAATYFANDARSDGEKLTSEQYASERFTGEVLALDYAADEGDTLQWERGKSATDFTL